MYYKTELIFLHYTLRLDLFDCPLQRNCFSPADTEKVSVSAGCGCSLLRDYNTNVVFLREEISPGLLFDAR